jgi:RNA polymerase sigma-70 factor (ECF subfamily)
VEAGTTSAAESLTGAGRAEPGAAGARLSELFNRHGATVLGLCRLLLRHAEEAEDAVQQTFLSAYRSLLNGVEPRHPAAWLATIARNECRARIEQRMREPLLDPEADAVSPMPDTVAAAAVRADLAALWQAIGELPRRQRKVLLLREFSGLSYAELAAALEVSEPTVESLLFRARRDLRLRLRPGTGLFAVAPLAAIRAVVTRAIGGLPDPSLAALAGKVAAGVAVAAVAGGSVAFVESGPPVTPATPAARAATSPARVRTNVVRATAPDHAARVGHARVVVPVPRRLPAPLRTVAPIAAAAHPPPTEKADPAPALATAPVAPTIPAEPPETVPSEPVTQEEPAAPPPLLQTPETTTEQEQGVEPSPRPVVSEAGDGDNSGPGSTESSSEGPSSSSGPGPGGSDGGGGAVSNEGSGSASSPGGDASGGGSGTSGRDDGRGGRSHGDGGGGSGRG